MEAHFKALIKALLHKAGLEVTRLHTSDSLLGLRHLPIRTVIDVGANEGQFAAQIRRLFPAIDLHCFEPLADPFAKLQDWARQQPIGKVRVYNCALGEREENRMMFLHQRHSASSSLLQSTDTCSTLYPQTTTQTPVPIHLTTLDKALGDGRSLYPKILIKLDTQGYEQRVIEGGMNTFRRAAACIVEANLFYLYAGQPTFTDLIVLLSSLGYRYAGNLEQVCTKRGEVIYVNALFLK